MDEITIIVEPIVTEVTVIVQEAGDVSPVVEARIAALEEFQLNGTINGGIIF